MATTVRSYAKINLGLAVGPARADGFHGLTTMYQTLALYDLVTVAAKPAAATRITLTADHPGVPSTQRGDAERNTAYTMVAGALRRMDATAEVALHIGKRLPVQGGLGAGSANAVAALLCLERELGKALPADARLELAAEVGSDVPLFLLGGTVLGLGRGEEVYPLPDLPRTWCVVAVPSVGVSTGLAFRELDARMAATQHGPEAAPLTFAQPPDRLRKLSRVLAGAYTVSGLEQGPSGIAGSPSSANAMKTQGNEHDLAENLLALVRTGIENDFEEVAFSQHPSLRDILRELKGPPGIEGTALYAALSGSGSALFGLYANRADADAAQHRVSHRAMQDMRVEAILTETLTRKAYWHGMFQSSQSHNPA